LTICWRKISIARFYTALRDQKQNGARRRRFVDARLSGRRERLELSALRLVHGDRPVVQVSLGVERDLAGHAVIVDLRDVGQELRRVGRIGHLHRLDDDHHRVIVVGRIDLHVGTEFLLVALLELLALRELVDRGTRYRADEPLCRVAGELDEFRRAAAVGHHELGADAEVPGLLGHGSARRVHAAVEDRVGIRTLDLGENRLEVGGLVGREFAGNDLRTRRLGRLFHFVRHALAVGSAVIDDRDLLGAHVLGDVRSERPTLLDVVGDDAECGLESLFGVLGIRRGRGDLRNAGVGVDLRRGNRRAGIEVPDHRGNLGVDELLRDDRALFRIGLIVLGDHQQPELLAADHDLPGVYVVDGHLDAVLVVLAQMRDRTGGRCGAADPDHQFGRARRRRSSRCRLRFLFPAADQRESERGDDR
jgi:hypothetical protein